MSNPKRTLQIVFCLALLSATVGALAAGRAASADPAPQGADDAKQPFQKMLVATLDGSEFNETVSFTVPAGKRLVIETVSANAAMPTGQKAIINVATVGGGQNGRAWLALAEQGNVSGLDRYAVAQSLRMYADPLTTVAFQVVRSGAASTASFNFSVAGYYVDAP